MKLMTQPDRARRLTRFTRFTRLTRLTAALAIGLAGGAFGAWWRWRAGAVLPVGDVQWAFGTAAALLAGRDPYAIAAGAPQCAPGACPVPYPLPVALFGLPLFWLPWPLASAIFVGVSCAVLAYALTARGEWWRLWLFTGAPLVVALAFAQWAPLLLAAWELPALAPLLVLVKPQGALPLLARRWSLPGLAVAGLVLAGSLLVMPAWPWRWLALTGPYVGLIPVTVLPWGPLLVALAALFWRDSRGRLLLATALLPLRAVYDAGAVFLLPRTQRQMLLLCLASWLPTPFIRGVGPGEAPLVPLLFLPAAALLAWQHRQQRPLQRPLQRLPVASLLRRRLPTAA